MDEKGNQQKKLLEMARSYASRRDNTLALECYNRALEINSTFADAWYFKAHFIAYYVLQIYHNPIPNQWVGLANKEKVDFKEAMRCINTSLNLNFSSNEINCRAWILKATLHEYCVEIEEGKRCREIAKRIDPTILKWM